MVPEFQDFHCQYDVGIVPQSGASHIDIGGSRKRKLLVKIRETLKPKVGRWNNPNFKKVCAGG